MNIHGVNETQGINEDDFVRICPSLIRQLQKGSCVEEKPGSSKVGEDSSKMLHSKLFVYGACYVYSNPKLSENLECNAFGRTFTEKKTVRNTVKHTK